MLDRNDDGPRPLAHKSVESLFKGQQVPVVKMFKCKKVWWIQTPSTTILFHVTPGQKSQFTEKVRSDYTIQKHLVFSANYQTPKMSWINTCGAVYLNCCECFLLQSVRRGIFPMMAISSFAGMHAQLLWVESHKAGSLALLSSLPIWARFMPRIHSLATVVTILPFRIVLVFNTS